MDFSSLKPQAITPSTEKAKQADAALFDFEVIEIPERRFQDSPKAATALNDRMAIAIAVFLVLVPVPYGAYRPLAWVAAMVCIGLMAAVYFALSAFFVSRNGTQIRNYWKVMVPGLMAIGFALFQMLPIPFGALEELPAILQPDRLTLSSAISGWGILRMISYALLFVLISEVCTNRQRTMRLLKWVFYGIVLHALWALISLGVLGDTLLLQEKTDYVGYATGTFINRNSFATFMGMGMVIGSVLAVSDMRALAHRRAHTRSKYKGLTSENMFLVVLVFIIFGALVLSASRLGILASILGTLFAVSAVLIRSGISKSKVLFGTFGVGVLALTLMLALAGGSVLERLVFVVVNSEGRTELYRQTLDMISSRPLLGFGLDTFPIAFEIFHKPELSTNLVWHLAHNTYLTLWSELGVVAGSLPPLAVAVAFASMVGALRDPDRNHVPAAAAAGVIVLGAVHSLGDFSLEIAANTYVFVAIVALGIARRRHENHGRGK